MHVFPFKVHFNLLFSNKLARLEALSEGERWKEMRVDGKGLGSGGKEGGKQNLKIVSLERSGCG